MNSPPQLTNWVSQNGDPCGQSWLGVTCSGSRVTTMWASWNLQKAVFLHQSNLSISSDFSFSWIIGRKLSGMQLNGTLGYNMNQLTALVQLLVRSFMLSSLRAPVFTLDMWLSVIDPTYFSVAIWATTNLEAATSRTIFLQIWRACESCLL